MADSAKKVADLAVKEVQKTVDAETDQGFVGFAVDPTPREHYTVSGVTAGKPTPETDEDSAEAASAVYRKGV